MWIRDLILKRTDIFEIRKDKELNSRILNILLLIVSFNLFADSTVKPENEKQKEKDKVIIRITIPINVRPEDGQTFMSIVYVVYESGKLFTFRSTEFAVQNQRTSQLTEEEMKKVKEIVHSLPKGLDEFAPGQLLKIIEYDGDIPKIRIYNRMKLPPKMKELFQLLGGVSFEIKDKIGYETEEIDN